MKIQIQLYAQLRDIVGQQNVLFDLPDGASISDLLENLYSKFPTLRAQDKTILTGVGVEFVDRNYKLKTGDNIAIMPPVQGG
jgi:MoaD family protein